MRKLLELRRDKGLSVRAAAEEIGVARATLERAERGESVYPGTAKLIADFYEVRVTEIWPVEEPVGR